LGALYVGLVLYGAATSLMIASNLGLDPWDVFHQGVSRLTGLSFGNVVIVVGVIVLLLWIPLRQRPGVGTVSNAILIGLTVNAVSAVLPVPTSLPVRWVYAAGGVFACGIATGLYIGARLGPGPRDGLMTGLVTRFAGRRWASIRLVRTVIEVSVLVAGYLLGGTVGWVTLLYAVSIGPLAHVTIPLFAVADPPEAPVSPGTPAVSAPGDRLPAGRA
jgi:uncharacterized membrane protein YczE